jgi:hypothetical protein
LERAKVEWKEFDKELCCQCNKSKEWKYDGLSYLLKKSRFSHPLFLKSRLRCSSLKEMRFIILLLQKKLNKKGKVYSK